ncbi:MAG TPA: hypothetical protein VHZ81_08450 [Galbitalea sp.]|jgi:hypothetical protein|nr:hypothetical protein [Galbitalea sp.]
METEPISPRPRLPRLRQWYAKMLYVIVVIALWYFVGGLPSTQFLDGLLRSVIIFVAFIVASRVFRGTDETSEPRSWWRATAKPYAGFVVGSALALAVIIFCVNAYGVETMPKLVLYSGQDVFDAVSALFCAVLAVFYFTSSIRLRGIAREARAEAERSAHAARKAKP